MQLAFDCGPDYCLKRKIYKRVSDISFNEPFIKIMHVLAEVCTPRVLLFLCFSGEKMCILCTDIK